MPEARLATRPLAREELVRQLLALGVRQGGVLLVHTAFSRVRPVEDGPLGLIAALRAVLGPNGTLVMPAMADDDVHAFDPATSPCHSMGIVASPHAFAAAGPHAPAITRDQPIDIPHGPDSPVGRAHDLDGQVLLLGVGHDANTTLHLAENLAGVRYRLQAVATVLVAGRVTRWHYEEVDHCCENFGLMDRWLDAAGLQRRGTVGHAEARLARSRDLVRVAVAHLQDDETVFLHPPGGCRECDEARASLP
jgi:aminoglycoside 3-N-acetyltransferase